MVAQEVRRIQCPRGQEHSFVLIHSGNPAAVWEAMTISRSEGGSFRLEKRWQLPDRDIALLEWILTKNHPHLSKFYN